MRYIKLGSGGGWEERSLTRGEVHFGYSQVPHKLALSGNRDRIWSTLVKAGYRSGDANNIARQVMDFYTSGSDTLWITFARGHLWWTFANPNVTWLGNSEDHGDRMRKAIGGWRNCDIHGRPLLANAISSRLTCVGNYRRTICGIPGKDYALRRINGIEEPVVKEARAAKAKLVRVVADAVSALDWRDFETLVDLIFTRSGWVRTSPLGGTQRDVDLVLEQPTTGELAMVQVKSAADQRAVADYVRRFNGAGLDRLFFVSHEQRRKLAAPKDKRIQVWAGEALATKVLALGLHDWVCERVG
jgi:hypothetical protein